MFLVWENIWFHIPKKRLKNKPKNLEKQGLEVVWELLKASWRPKIFLRLSSQIWVNFGRARIGQNLAKLGQDGTKLQTRWRQDLPSWGQDGHLEAKLGPRWEAFLSIFRGLGSDLYENDRSVQSSVLAILADFGQKLGSLGRSWPEVGLSWAILASSWELLGNMLGLRWPKMA